MENGLCSKTRGDLSVLNLYTQNEALILKYLDKFFNRADIPWIHLVWEKHYSNGKLPNHIKRRSFWWRDVLKLLDKFKGMIVVTLENGSYCYLWTNL